MAKVYLKVREGDEKIKLWWIFEKYTALVGGGRNWFRILPSNRFRITLRNLQIVLQEFSYLVKITAIWLKRDWTWQWNGLNSCVDLRLDEETIRRTGCLASGTTVTRFLNEPRSMWNPVTTLHQACCYDKH
jgi:hypothetical protein